MALKDLHEKELDLFIREINKREKLIDSASRITDIASQMNKKEKVGKKS